jgi:hypothetical protein
MPFRPGLLAAAAALAVTVSACGSSSNSSSSSSASEPVNPNSAEVSPPGDIPDDQAFVRYAPPGAGFSVEVPEGWARRSAGGAVTFTDKLNSVRMEAVAKLTPVSGRARKVSKVQRTAGTAILTRYLAKSTPDPVTGKVRLNDVERYVFHHGGSNVVLTLSGPKGADNVDPWQRITDSLRFTG